MIELLALALMRAQVAASFGVALVLMLRLPARWLFGPRLAYWLWAIAPAAAIASLFPSLSESLEIGATTAPLAPGLALAAVAAWLAGAALFAAFVVRQERAFRRLADRGEAGPAVMGALWPRLVLPTDFADRFSARERELILLHERTHIRRGDPMANLIVAGCRALGWFNPMVHVGAAFLRIDQELACDASVLALRTDIRSDYARALLKVSMVGKSSPLACGWGTHPLILRVGFLGRTEPSRRREIVGFLALTVLALVTVFGVWTLAPRGFDQHAFAPDALYAAGPGRD
ncbi:M56 family metallopeptidase [Caulobacter sp. RL271]|jgi:beta-lactamase regulating signal transducer with metallopeptidase domain|uniref:Peptidase M56 n=1 Tax=Caulobacter segnis TaxID=88688 RepID=A0ABY4ZPP8_9CAUL|nr:M56 family metallopeptidase [Caulobacter segnis]USQ94772.1 peptidase M56 [Caulobacter segnis]